MVFALITSVLSELYQRIVHFVMPVVSVGKKITVFSFEIPLFTTSHLVLLLDIPRISVLVGCYLICLITMRVHLKTLFIMCWSSQRKEVLLWKLLKYDF